MSSWRRSNGKVIFGKSNIEINMLVNFYLLIFIWTAYCDCGRWQQNGKRWMNEKRCGNCRLVGGYAIAKSLLVSSEKWLSCLNFNLYLLIYRYVLWSWWTKWTETDEKQLGKTIYNFGYDSFLQLHFGSFGIGLWLDFISTMLLLTMPVIDIEPILLYCFTVLFAKSNINLTCEYFVICK